LPAGLQVGAMTLRLAADGGGVVRDVPASLVERRSGASGAYDVAVLEWTPPELPRGAYLLSFATRPAAGKGLESPPTRMLSPGGEGAKLWTELDIGRAEKLTALPAAPRAARDDKHELEEYRAALARLAAGDRASALSAVAAMEVRVLTTRKHFEDLRDIERKLLLGLAERDAEALLPVALLHQELLRRYLSEGKPGFPRHALDTTLWIAERYAERGKEEGQRAAQVVISLAGWAIDAGAPRRAAELLGRASAMDPSNELARLGRAAVLTRIGDLLGARSELARLLEVQPGQREARLRLALLSLRAGDEGRTEHDLRALVAGDPPADWVTALAYQELARLLLRDKRVQAAKELMTEAARRLPNDPGVLIALSYAREMSGDRVGAQAELSRRAALAGGGETARRRFSRWPDEALRTARLSFQEDALLRLPLLAAALGKAPVAA
jgi:tetratricopeptide (TPR) repeat protein